MNFSILILLCITVHPGLLLPGENEDEVQKSYMDIAQEKFETVKSYIPGLSRVPFWKRALMYTALVKNTTTFIGRVATPYIDHTPSSEKSIMTVVMRSRLKPATEVGIPAPAIQTRLNKPPTVTLDSVMAEAPFTAEYFTVFENACVLCIMSHILEIKNTLVNKDTNTITQWAVYENKAQIKRTIASMFKFKNDTSLKSIFLDLYELYQLVDEANNGIDENKNVLETLQRLEQEFQKYLNFTFRMNTILPSWLILDKSDHDFSDYAKILKNLLSGQKPNEESITKFQKFLNMCSKLMLIITETGSLNSFMKILDQKTSFNENEEHFYELIKFTFTTHLVNKKDIKYTSKKPILSFITPTPNNDNTNAGGIGQKITRGISSAFSLWGTPNPSTPPSRLPSNDNANEIATNTEIEKTPSNISQQKINGPTDELILQHFNTILCVFSRFVTLTTGEKIWPFVNNPEDTLLTFVKDLFQEYIEILEWTRQFESMTDQITDMDGGQKNVEAFINTFAYYIMQFRSVINALIIAFQDERDLLKDNEKLYLVYRVNESNTNQYLDHIFFPKKELIEAAKRSFQFRFDSQANCKQLDVSINFESLKVVDKNELGTRFGFKEEMDGIKLQRMNSQLSLRNLLKLKNYKNTDNLYITKTIQASGLSILYPPIKR